MKKIYYLLSIILMCVGCQKESLIIEQDEEIEAFTEDTILTNLILNVSAHDGSFDDIVDGSSCFSINFPYNILVSGKTITISSIQDIKAITEGAVTQIVYPITISKATYEEEVIQNSEAFEAIKQACEDGLLYNERIVCLDFQYPVEMGVFDETSNSFDFVSLEHDKQTFTSIISILQTTRASLRYPIYLLDHNNNEIEIVNNEQLKSTIELRRNSCK